MKKDDAIFPSVKRSLENFVNDEEGNIPRGKLLTIGTMVILLSTILSIESFAAHGSHGSHGSHASHSSSSYVRSHSNHSSHSNHDSHASHSSHTSHSNTVSHSNSNYSAGGDYFTATAPSASSITGVKVPTASPSGSIPPTNIIVEAPNSTPLVYSTIPALEVPSATPATDYISINTADPLITPKAHKE